MYNIGIVKDLNTKWWIKFEEYIKERGVSHKLVDIEQQNWIEQIAPCECIIWRPNLSEPYLTQAREKLFFLQNILNKTAYPNQECFWHYNNKNAQSYLFDHYGIKTPAHFISYSYEDAHDYLVSCSYPVVSKALGGAGGENVRLLRNYKEAKSELDYLFNRGLTNRAKRKLLSITGLKRTLYDSQYSYVNFQQFIPENTRDFRVTTIGDCYAFAFYRNNRENDFRASGSGHIDYESRHDLRAIKYCMEISRKCHFDSVCYDILYDKDDFYICEFSYIFNDEAIYNCPGYYKFSDNEMEFIQGHKWPQELIVDYLFKKWA